MSIQILSIIAYKVNKHNLSQRTREPFSSVAKVIGNSQLASSNAVEFYFFMKNVTTGGELVMEKVT